MIDFSAFSDELSKIAMTEEQRDALRHSVAAGLGTAAGIASADLLAHVMKTRYPHLAPAMRSKAAKYGIPGLATAGSVYASHKYQKRVNDAYDRLRDGQQ